MITKADLTANKKEIISELMNYTSDRDMIISLMEDLVDRLYIGFETWQEAVKETISYNGLDRVKKENPKSLSAIMGKIEEQKGVDLNKNAKKYMVD